jgi:hypothetical protein
MAAASAMSPKQYGLKVRRNEERVLRAGILIPKMAFSVTLLTFVIRFPADNLLSRSLRALKERNTRIDSVQRAMLRRARMNFL